MNQFFRFCVVGTVGFLVDVGVLHVLAGSLGWYLARLVSFAAAVTATWALNRRFTFATKSSGAEAAKAGIAHEYARYVTSMLGGAAVNYATYAAVLHFWPGPLAGTAGVAAGSVAGLGVNFAAARGFVFKNSA